MINANNYNNKSNKNSGSTGGIGFTGALQITFIVLKLCKVINWSWFWVLAPTWFSIVLLILVILFIIFVK